jgi:hypothetical protein
MPTSATAVTDIVFTPALPWPVIAALGVACTLLLGYGAARGAGGILWRTVAFAAGLAALADPTVVEEVREPLRDVVAVVVDRSPSQALGERPAATERARAALEDALAAISGVETRVVDVSGGGEAEDGTFAFRARARGLADVPPDRIAATVVITDGQVHDAPEAADGAWTAGPVHVLLTGARGERDRRLVVETAPRYGLVGADLALRVRVEDGGDAPPTVARVTLRRDGGAPERITLRTEASQVLPLTLEHGGETVIEIEVEPAAGELSLRNNRAAVAINGVRDRLRVLLVSGVPHPGQRTWRTLLKADPSVDLVHFTILRPPEKQDGTPTRDLALIAFPVHELFEIKLGDFDLVIFDRYRRRWLMPSVYLQNVAEYVRAGGAVLEAAGPSFATELSLYRTPLGEVLPARPTGAVLHQPFRPALTDSGRRHPVTATLRGTGSGATEDDGPVWGRWLRLIEADAEGGAVLMSGPAERPLLLLDRVGEGRVAQLLSDHGWLWARGYDGGGPQAELLRRLVHWLMKEPDLEENDLRASAKGDVIEIVRRSLAPENAPVTVTSPSGASVAVALEEGDAGEARARFAAAESGLYRVSDGAHTAVAAVGTLNPREFADVRASAAPLAGIVERSGASLTWLEDGAIPELRRMTAGRKMAGPGWMGLRANGAFVVAGVRELPLMPALVVLALFLGGLMAAWRHEGR